MKRIFCIISGNCFDVTLRIKSRPLSWSEEHWFYRVNLSTNHVENYICRKSRRSVRQISSVYSYNGKRKYEFSLEEKKIAGLKLAYADAPFVDKYGNLHRQIGSFVTESGEELTMTDVVFGMNRTLTTTDMLPVPEDIAALPDARGYGTTYNLHQAMVRDGSGRLKALVAEFVAAADPAARLALTDQILFVWTGQSEGEVTERRKSLCPRNTWDKLQSLSVQTILPDNLSARVRAIHYHPGGAPCKQQKRKPHPDCAFRSRVAPARPAGYLTCATTSPSTAHAAYRSMAWNASEICPIPERTPY